MHEQIKLQHVSVKMYRTPDRLMIAAPMPGLEPENIMVQLSDQGHLTLHGEVRGMLKDAKELLLDEWSVGTYHRELDLPVAVDGLHANLTYGNGVLLVAFPISEQTHAAHLTLNRVAPTHGMRKGNAGHVTWPGK